MRFINAFLVGAALLMLAACANPLPISNNPIQTVANAAASTPLGGTVVQGLKDSAFNLDSAIQIGVLQAGDPVDGCVHGALQKIGQDVTLTGDVIPVTPAQQFTPKVSDLLSAGSVAYILSVQAKALAANSGALVPAQCEQIVGHMVLTGVNAPAIGLIKGAIGALP